MEAFRLSIKRALTFEETYKGYLLDGRVVSPKDFQKAMRYVARDEEDDLAAGSLADELDAVAEAREYIESLLTVDLNQYELRTLAHDVERDVELLKNLYTRTEPLVACVHLWLSRTKTARHSCTDRDFRGQRPWAKSFRQLSKSNFSANLGGGSGPIHAISMPFLPTGRRDGSWFLKWSISEVQDVFASEQLADLVIVDWDVSPDDDSAVEVQYAGERLRASVSHPIVYPLRQLAGSEIEAVIDAACEREEVDDAVA